MNVMIVCGGTGGHLFPGIAVGEELLERKHQVLLVISEKEIDRKVAEGTRGFLFQTLPAVGWRGWNPISTWRFFQAMIRSLMKTRQIFRDFHPQVVMGMGGFSSVAPLFLAWLRGVPSCVHESNMIVGKANRLTSRFVQEIAVGFEAARLAFAPGRAICTGTPLRASIRQAATKHARKGTDFRRKEEPTVLVMGGSQGAQSLNRLVIQAMTILPMPGIRWIHLSGAEDETFVRQAYTKEGKEAKVLSFSHEMDALYAEADLVIARSGAASLAEIAEWSLPSILIPYPYATDRHQEINARQFAETGAAIMMEERFCGPDDLAGEVGNILGNKKRWESMLDATRTLDRGDAHRKLADMVERMGERR